MVPPEIPDETEVL